jgi:hypothetical protein
MNEGSPISECDPRVWTTPVKLEAVGSGKDERHGNGGEIPGGAEAARGGDGA